MSKPKILIYDIEILNNTKDLHDFAWRSYPGASMGANQSGIISFGYKTHGDDKAKCINVWDKKFSKNNQIGNIVENKQLIDVVFYDDFLLCEEIYNIMVEADAIVSFYGSKFDIKHINARLLHHGFPALPNFRSKHIDLHSIAKERLKLSHKRLNDLCKFLGVPSKIDTGGYKLWDRVFKGEKAAQKEMSDYCTQDVEALDNVFFRMKSLCSNLPTNWLENSDGSDAEQCPHCDSKNFESKGWRSTKVASFRRFLCRDCGCYFHGDKKGLKMRVE